MQRFTTKVTRQGQVTLPAEFRRVIGVNPGDMVDLVGEDDGRATLKKRRSIEELVGSLNHLSKQLGRVVNQADIDAAAADAMDEREKRSRRPGSR